MVERWHQLPLGHALSCLPMVRELVQALADEVADAEGRDRVPVPHLGPAVVMDQLRVMVHDRTTRGVDPGHPAASLDERLAALRRAL